MNEICVVSFLYGVTLKIYDDIIDNKLPLSKIYIDIFCYLTLSLMTIIFYLSPAFSILWTEMAGVSLILDKIYTCNIKQDTTDSKNYECMNDFIWMYSLILSSFFACYHYFNAEAINFNTDSPKNKSLLIFAVINFIIVTCDIYFTPEHSSNKKYYARIVLMVIISVIIFYMVKYSLYFYDGVIGIMLMNMGFLVASVTYMTFEDSNFINKLKTTINNPNS
uniref:Uncharacterized protein n=1 Tax=viral metagenome TaxID=1070528 RepID=A0A6C0BZJ7_9ZZZZ